MAKIPKGLESPEFGGLKLISDGKVRGTYVFKDQHPSPLVQLATDRISIFNFILNAKVPQKGEILTAMTIFWLEKVLKNFKSHLDFFGSSCGIMLPVGAYREDPDLWKRVLIIQNLILPPIEAIVRGYLTGSGWKSYQKSGECYGHKLPEGLWDGAKLPFPIFTPTEKSEDDAPISHEEVVKRFGGTMERVSMQAYWQALDFAISRGIILADTKFEMTNDGIIGDEVITPDSSRFWDLKEWQKLVAEKKSPTSLDKEFVRKWGKSVGIHELDPKSLEHIARVESILVPTDVIENTRRIYRYIFWRLTGKKLEVFQSEVMNIPDVSMPRVKIAIVIGSQSDLLQCQPGRDFLLGQMQRGNCNVDFNIISCHRNPKELLGFVQEESTPDVVIAGAGMAAALPGILKSLYVSGGKAVPVIGVAFEGKNNAETLAAQLSIEKLPGSPVILGPDGVFTGGEGFMAACKYALESEFQPEAPKEQKKACLHMK
ncbi:MAG: phosphoribosylaminoimidazolesuccinocarboxamide synthase [Patescibacteria group bacterium]|nr:phosphoribosylaminoimidazolesuccinocarboxamide synthase [Patescibacteria group bacterium]